MRVYSTCYTIETENTDHNLYMLWQFLWSVIAISSYIVIKVRIND